MSRGQKRLYLPKPAPRILHFTGRSSRRTTPAGKVEMGGGSRKEKLGTLFERERRFRRSGEGRVKAEEEGEGDEAWRFQEEVLRAECNMLRMETEITVKKLRRSQLSAEKILRSTIHALIEGKRRISEGVDIESVIEEEVENLVGKLSELRRKTRGKESEGGRSCSDFDKQVAVLQRRLDKLGGVGIPANPAKEVIRVQYGGDNMDCGNCKVELLRRKMEGLSKEVLPERMFKEYGPMLSMSRHIEWQPPQPAPAMRELNHVVNESTCSGHCKAVVWRIIEQVRSEMEQWSQIQAILGQVRDEMEELQASRDFWEDRSLENDCRSRSLSSAAREWRQKAVSCETKVNELQGHVAKLQEEVERLRKEEVDEGNPEISGETEKRVVICRLREHRRSMENERPHNENSNPIEQRRKVRASNVASLSLFPFKDITNLSLRSRKNRSLP